MFAETLWQYLLPGAILWLFVNDLRKAVQDAESRRVTRTIREDSTPATSRSRFDLDDFAASAGKAMALR